MFRNFLHRRPTFKEITLEKAPFNLWQEVWCMHRNAITKVRIVSVEVRGVYCQLTRKCIPAFSYQVTDSNYYSVAHGVAINGKELFATKQELLSELSK